jgi:hypothetical protein
MRLKFSLRAFRPFGNDRLNSSAWRAANVGGFFAPAPPMMIGGLGDWAVLGKMPLLLNR